QTNSIPAVGRPNDIVDIRAGMLFPFPFRVFGAIFILTGVVMMLIEPIPSVLLIIIGIGVVTAYEGDEIDPAHNTFSEYYSFLTIRKGSRRTFSRIEKLFIHSSALRERIPMATFWWSHKLDRVDYNAYVKFSEGTRVFLFSHGDKKEVVERLNRIASTLNVPVADYTGPDHD